MKGGAGKGGSTSSTSTTMALSREDTLKAKCLKELSVLRLKVTTELKMKNPEYVVSSVAMSSQLPTSKEQMLNLEGYTEIKWDRFQGEQFLKVTREYASQVDKLHPPSSSSTTTTSCYFDREGVESEGRPRPVPVIGKGKRKKVGGAGGGGDGYSGSSDAGPQAKKQALMHFTRDYNSEDKSPSKNTPSKGLLPHPNNR